MEQLPTSDKRALAKSLSIVNEKLSYYNNGAVVSSLANLLSFAVILMVSFFFIASSSAWLFFSQVLERVPILGAPFVLFPLIFTGALVIIIVLREMVLREGRVLFEIGGEYEHKTRRESISIEDIEDRSLYIEIKKFAINETLPFTMGYSRSGSMWYLQLNMMVFVMAYATLAATFVSA